MPDASASFRKSGSASFTRPVVIDTAKANTKSAALASPAFPSPMKKSPIVTTYADKRPATYSTSGSSSPGSTGSSAVSTSSKMAKPTATVITTGGVTKDPPRTKNGTTTHWP